MACNRGLHVYFGGRPCQGQQNQLQRSWGPKHCWVFPLLPVQQKEGKNTSLGNENPGPRPGPSWEALDRKWLGNKLLSYLRLATGSSGLWAPGMPLPSGLQTGLPLLGLWDRNSLSCSGGLQCWWNTMGRCRWEAERVTRISRGQELSEKVCLEIRCAEAKVWGGGGSPEWY